MVLLDKVFRSRARAHRGGQPAEPRYVQGSPLDERFRRVLLAASDTRYYKPWLAAARLGTPARIRRLHSASEGLAGVPKVPGVWFQQHRAEFVNRRAQPFRPLLTHPFQPQPRTAILDGRFQPGPNDRIFQDDRLDPVEAWQPESIAAPADLLLLWAARVPPGKMALPCLKHSIVVFSHLDRGLLTPHDRDLLWRAFGLPVFEQLRGYSGELLASECEGHDGLHLIDGEAIFEVEHGWPAQMIVSTLVDLHLPSLRVATGWVPRFSQSVCPCGLAGSRILSMEPAVPHVKARAAAG